ncbi:MAG: lipoyl domain-containing protein [bacterium]|nr:lipoyl domain-containing protein [bacterium]
MSKHADVVIPAFSDSIDDVRISNWLKNEGDDVTFGEPVVELEVNKAAVEVEAPADGILEAIYCWEGEEVIEGERVGVIILTAADGDEEEEFDFADSEKYDI